MFRTAIGRLSFTLHVNSFLNCPVQFLTLSVHHVKLKYKWCSSQFYLFPWLSRQMVALRLFLAGDCNIDDSLHVLLSLSFTFLYIFFFTEQDCSIFYFKSQYSLCFALQMFIETTKWFTYQIFMCLQMSAAADSKIIPQWVSVVLEVGWQLHMFHRHDIQGTIWDLSCQTFFFPVETSESFHWI